MHKILKQPYSHICRIVRRTNRFKIEVKTREGIGYAYINNTGRLKEYLVHGKKAYCIKRDKPGKTQYRLFAVEDTGGAALIDTQLQMKAFEKLVEDKRIPWLKNCMIMKKNPRLGSSILDYLLGCNNGKIYVEIKSAVMRGDKIYAMYPDCPTLRGRRHIRELSMLASKNGRGIIVFIAGLPGVKAFKPYGGGDPEIPLLLREAINAGVVVKAINIYYNPLDKWIILVDPDLPVVLD